MSESAATSDDGASLTFVNHVAATNLDPDMTACTCDNLYLTPVYDRLVHFDAQLNPIPGLATDWEWDEDGTQLRMQLREDVLFHDGERFDAAAAEANIKRSLELEGSHRADEIGAVESVEVTSDDEITITLERPDATVLRSLGERAGMMISPAALDNEDLDINPVGAGPYVVTASGEAEISYAPFEDYWNADRQHLSELHIQALPDANARLNAIRTGRADAGTLMDSSLFAEAMNEEGVVADPDQPMLGYETIFLNRSRSEPLGDARVRQALNHAIDRDALAQAVMRDLAQPASQMFPVEGYPGHDSDLEGYYDHDPDRARELLSDAGYEGGFELDIVFPAYNTPAAEAVQQMLGVVGVEATIRPTEPAQVAELFYVDEQADAMISSTTGQPDPAEQIYYRFMPEGQANPGGHTTDRLAELYEQAVEEVDPDLRHEVLLAASREVLDEALEVPLYSIGGFLGVVHREGIEGLREPLYFTPLEEARVLE